MNPFRLFEDLLSQLRVDIFDKLPHYLYYHNLYHTQNVTNAAMLLAKEAALSELDKENLYAAAVLHDTGYSKRYESNECFAVDLARHVLPSYGFSPQRIAVISKMILATNMATHPKTQLAKLLADADMAYLGHPDFLRLSDNLLNEWREVGQFQGSNLDWLKVQVKFVDAHSYHTPEAERIFKAQKAANLITLQQLQDWPK